MKKNRGEKALHLAVLLMAAGESSRLGQAKQLVQYQGQSLLHRQVELMLSLTDQHSQSSQVIVGFQQDQMIAELASTQLLQQTNIVKVANWQQGLSTSIATAVSQIDVQVDAVLIFMVDQWQLNGQHLIALIEQWRQAPNNIHMASLVDKNNHKNNKLMSPPVIFPKALFTELQNITGDDGAKMVIKQNQGFVTTLDMPSAFVDLDNPEQLNLLQRHEENSIVALSNTR